MTQAQMVLQTIPAILALVGLVKPLLEATVLPPASPVHDPVLRLLVVGMATLAVPLEYLVTTTRVDALGIWSAAAFGLTTGLSTLGVYHAATGNLTPAGG